MSCDLTSSHFTGECVWIGSIEKAGRREGGGGKNKAILYSKARIKSMDGVGSGGGETNFLHPFSPPVQISAARNRRQERKKQPEDERR